MIDESLLKREEKAVFSLRALYRRYGYRPYKMSKFETYELYAGNKDFLVSDRVITFNDTDGKLLALKPDVTLSIIKNGDDVPGVKQKVCYNENVYRVSDSTHRYKEILQTGLECVGDLDEYDIFEVISLAAESLGVISPSFLLEVSDLGVISDILDGVSAEPAFRRQALSFLGEKNAHDLKKLCAEYGVGEDGVKALTTLITATGQWERVVEAIRPFCSEARIAGVEKLGKMLALSPFRDRIHLDFSVVNDMGYYNGFVFRGFLDGVCDGVLAGGQYDRMMEKMGRTSGAIGFALYLDMLEQLGEQKTGYDVNVLLVYDDAVPADTVAEKVQELVGSGLTVSAQKAVPEKLRYRERIDLRGGEKTC